MPLIESAAQFVGHVRTLDVDKPPGSRRRSTGWPRCRRSGVTELVREDVVTTLGAIAKTPDDRDVVLARRDSYGYG